MIEQLKVLFDLNEAQSSAIQTYWVIAEREKQVAFLNLKISDGTLNQELVDKIQAFVTLQERGGANG